MERVIESLELVLDMKEEELKNINCFLSTLRKNMSSNKLRSNALDLSILGQDKIIKELNENGSSDVDEIMVLHRETRRFVISELDQVKTDEVVLNHKINDLVTIATDLILDIKEIKAFILKERSVYE